MSLLLELHDESGERILVNPAHIQTVHPRWHEEGWTAAKGCGCQPGTCESKPTGCRMAEEVKPGSGAQ